MELSNEQKANVLNGLVAQLESERYQQEVLARTWGKVGNAAKVNEAAQAITNATIMLDSVQAELKELECEVKA